MRFRLCIAVTVLALCPLGAAAEQVLCESQGGHYTECPLNTRGNVRILKKLSDAPCKEGKTWGVRRHGVWVDDGCRAVFVSDADDHDRAHDSGHSPQRRPPEERCPAGFTPSEQKCTQKERARGCKDIRLPGGLGCVKR